MSNLHKTFLSIVDRYNLPNSDKIGDPNLLIAEVKFCNTRQYRFDFAWPYIKIAVELNGGIFSKGGHNSISGLQRDYEKLNHAQATGWMVLQFDASMLRDGDYVASVIYRAFEERR